MEGWRNMTLLMVSVGVLEALDTNELRELDERDDAEEARRKLVRMPAGEKRLRMVWNRDGDCILADGTSSLVAGTGLWRKKETGWSLI